MIFGWLKRRRRLRLLQMPFPAAWHEYLQSNVRLYAWLEVQEQALLRDVTRILVSEKHWEGCGGLTVTDEVKVTIAAQVALMLLGLPGFYFERTPTILVYPDAYLAPHRHHLSGGGTLEGWEAREGEAWYRGPVVLAWSEVVAGGRGESGRENVVIHEFAHQLDMFDGYPDGVPACLEASARDSWTKQLKQQFRAYRRAYGHGDEQLSSHGGDADLVEFFAVASEWFFMQPRAMRTEMPQLYGLLSTCYRQNPADRSGWDAPF